LECSDLNREELLAGRRVLGASDDPAAVLVRLLVLGERVETEQVAAALPRTGVEGMIRLGLARAAGPDRTRGGGRTLQGTCDLRPYGDDRHDWWVASDLSELALGAVLPTDHVLGVGGASTALASWTPRPRVARALDLGTGCGVQALHATTHAEHVVATDLSARALQFARFTAELNGVELDLREGSLLEPVAGEQ